jgi:hypothetical protein
VMVAGEDQHAQHYIQAEFHTTMLSQPKRAGHQPTNYCSCARCPTPWASTGYNSAPARVSACGRSIRAIPTARPIKPSPRRLSASNPSA